MAYRREFTAMFENECALFSSDDYQIPCFFPVDDTPNVPDPDFPTPEGKQYKTRFVYIEYFLHTSSDSVKYFVFSTSE